MMQPSGEVRTKTTPDGITYVETFEPALKENRLLSFDQVMALEETRRVKHAVPERKTDFFSFTYQNRPYNVFIKRHFPFSPARFIRERIRLASTKTAYDEFENILAFLRAGIPTMMPIAAGKRKCGLWGTRSFLMTEAIEGCMTLEQFAETVWGKTGFQDKKRLILNVARLTRKMHDCGFNHRDYYLCHLLIGVAERNRDELFVMDLHRVDIREKVPERWIIKDLAALYYSCLPYDISRTNKLRFFKDYLSCGKLSVRDKDFALKVIDKSRRMLKHAGRKKLEA